MKRHTEDDFLNFVIIGTVVLFALASTVTIKIFSIFFWVALFVFWVYSGGYYISGIIRKTKK